MDQISLVEALVGLKGVLGYAPAGRVSKFRNESGRMIKALSYAQIEKHLDLSRKFMKKQDYFMAMIHGRVAMLHAEKQGFEDLFRQARVLTGLAAQRGGIGAARRTRRGNSSALYSSSLRMYSECAGISGEPTVESIASEAEWAIKFLMIGKREFVSHNWTEAIDLFFKSANIATNVISTAHMHEIDLPENILKDMENVAAEATMGIKKVMKAMAAKVMIHHERDFHKGQPVLQKGAAAYMRRLTQEEGKCCKG